MATPDNFLWEMISGKIPSQMLNQFKAEYAKRQGQSVASSLPMAPNVGPFGDMARGMWNAQEQIKQYSPDQIDAAKDYKYETPKLDTSGIHYNIANKPSAIPSAAPGLLAGVGSVGMTMANIGKPSVGLGALSGAATGAGYGAMFGPVGMGIGAAIGGLTGLVSTGLNRSNYEEGRLQAEKGKIKAATVFGSDIGEFEGGGNVGGQEGELTPIQTEKGETITLPTGHIFKSKSKKTHKQMEKGLITDVLPPEAYVGSSSKKNLISKDKADKMILGYDAIEYTEEGNSSMPKENTLGDIFKRNKMTPAELMNIVKNKFPTNDIVLDPFARRASVENLKSRIPFINAIIAATGK